MDNPAVQTELKADDSQMSAACIRAEKTIKKLGQTCEDTGEKAEFHLSKKTGRTFSKMGAQVQALSYGMQGMGPGLSSFASGTGAVTEALGKASSATYLFSSGAAMLQGLMTGPLGFALLGAAAIYTGITMLKAKEAAEKEAEALKKQAEQAEKTAERMGQLATVMQGGGVRVWMDAATATGKHKKAQEELAEAVGKVEDAQYDANKALEKHRDLQKAVDDMKKNPQGLSQQIYADTALTLTGGPRGRVIRAVDAGKESEEAQKELDKMKDLLEKAKLREVRRRREAEALTEQEKLTAGIKSIDDEIAAVKKLGDQYGFTESQKRRAAFMEKYGPLKDKVGGDFLSKQGAFEDAERILTAKEKKAAYDAMTKTLTDQATAVDATAESMLRAKAAQEGFTAAQIENLVFLQRVKEQKEKSKKEDEFIASLEKEIQALGKSTDELRANEAARMGIFGIRGANVETMTKGIEALKKGQATADSIKSAVETPAEKLAREKKELMEARALNIASGGQLGIDETTYKRARLAAAERFIASEKTPAQFKANFEDIRSLTRRIQASRASGEDPALKAQERAAKAAEVTAKEVAAMNKAVEQMNATLRAGGRVVSVLGK